MFILDQRKSLKKLDDGALRRWERTCCSVAHTVAQRNCAHHSQPRTEPETIDWKRAEQVVCALRTDESGDATSAGRSDPRLTHATHAATQTAKLCFKLL